MSGIDSQVTALILAGGQGSRMAGQDKGWVLLAGRPFIEHVIERVRPQAAALFISANRHQERYAALGVPVVSDESPDYQGPLAGIASALRAIHTDYLLVVPCDTPFLPRDLARRLLEALLQQQADIAVAEVAGEMHPLCCVLRRTQLPHLLQFLESGQRTVKRWVRGQRFVAVDFSDQPRAFTNLNTPEELRQAEQESGAAGAGE